MEYDKLKNYNIGFINIKISDNLLKYQNGYGDSLYFKNVDFLKDSNFFKSKLDSYISFVHTDNLSEKEIVNCRNKIDAISKCL